MVGSGVANWNTTRDDIRTNSSSMNLLPGNRLGLTISVTSVSNSLSESDSDSESWKLKGHSM